MKYFLINKDLLCVDMLYVNSIQTSPYGVAFRAITSACITNVMLYAPIN